MDINIPMLANIAPVDSSLELNELQTAGFIIPLRREIKRACRHADLAGQMSNVGESTYNI
jgi:hypothetical protein